MAPEHDARTRAFYDHESDEPHGGTRRRRQVADWGVGEDVFDRMPSRRFTRAGRRAEHHEEERGESRTIVIGGDEEPRAGESRTIVLGDDESRRGESRTIVLSSSDGEPRRGESRTIVLSDNEPRRGESRTIVLSDEDEPRRRESRTIVVSGDDAFGAIDVGPDVYPTPSRYDDRWTEAPPEGRRTVVIRGRPDRLPAPRPKRPPRTAMERVGARPDRIAGYAVALGFLLILIAVLTTNQ